MPPRYIAGTYCPLTGAYVGVSRRIEELRPQHDTISGEWLQLSQPAKHFGGRLLNQSTRVLFLLILWGSTQFSHLGRSARQDKMLSEYLSVTIEKTASILESDEWEVRVTNRGFKDVAAFSIEFTGYSTDGAPHSLGMLITDQIWSFPDAQRVSDPGSYAHYGPLRPGSSLLKLASFPANEDNPYIEITARVLMILFIDNSWLGDQSQVNYLFDEHAGAAAQLTQLMALLSSLGPRPSPPALSECASSMVSPNQAFKGRPLVPAGKNAEAFKQGASWVCKLEGDVLLQMAKRRSSLADTNEWLQATIEDWQNKANNHYIHSKPKGDN